MKYSQAIFLFKIYGWPNQEVGKDLLPYIYIYIYTGVVSWLERSN